MKNAKKAVLILAAAGLAAGASAGSAFAADGAKGAAAHSPGILSGNLVQAPVHVPVNVTGDTISVIGSLNSAFGNVAANR